MKEVPKKELPGVAGGATPTDTTLPWGPTCPYPQNPTVPGPSDPIEPIRDAY